ncbi:hypothetical protein PENTCL1PPCAC_17332, partial [Pristionchus entomophagus]
FQMRCLLLLFLILSTGSTRHLRRPPTSINGVELPPLKCFVTSKKEIRVNHADSAHKDWRKSPLNYWDAMSHKIKTTISRTERRELPKENEEVKDWRPMKDPVTTRQQCNKDIGWCCVVENYEDVNYRFFRCGTSGECQKQLPYSDPNKGPARTDGNLVDENEEVDSMPFRDSEKNISMMLCVSSLRSPCQFRGHN